jgi:hypothetical protein
MVTPLKERALSELRSPLSPLLRRHTTKEFKLVQVSLTLNLFEKGQGTEGARYSTFHQERGRELGVSKVGAAPPGHGGIT